MLLSKLFHRNMPHTGEKLVQRQAGSGHTDFSFLLFAKALR